MAKAPDPRAVAAQIAEAEAREEAERIRKIRESMVVWLILDGQRRTLRFLDTTARQVSVLRAAGFPQVDRLFIGLADAHAGLDMFIAGWWLAGAQAGLVEKLDDMWDMTYQQAPLVHHPSDEELSTDEVGDDDPPA